MFGDRWALSQWEPLVVVMTSDSVLGHIGGWVRREVGKVTTENLLAESVTYFCPEKGGSSCPFCVSSTL